MKKRGQVTAFIVIALIILMTGAFFFVYRLQTVKEPEVVPAEFKPIEDYVGSCLKIVAEDAIRLAGINGGYISYPPEVQHNPRSYLAMGPMKEIKLPYWWYEGVEAVPSEDFVKKQIADYVNKQLDECVGDFEDLVMYEIDRKGRAETKITWDDDSVSADVYMPVDVYYKLNRTKIRLSNFKVDIPIRLKKAYEFANYVMEMENNDFFFEKKAIDLLALDPEIPTTDFEFSCSDKVWQLTAIKQKMKRLLQFNLPYVRVKNTGFIEDAYVQNPFGKDSYNESYYWHHYRWLLNKTPAEGLKATFAYDERWPIVMRARPSDGNTLRSRPQKGFDVAKFLCIHVWHFNYDLEFPVKATIVDEAAGGHEDFVWNFAFMVKVDHNEPKREKTATKIFEAQFDYDSTDYCAEPGYEQTIFTRAATPDSEDITGINITYVCGMFSCDMGTTEWLDEGAAAGLTREFPYCVNGIVRARGEGYEDKDVFVTVNEPGDSHMVALRPVTYIDNINIAGYDAKTLKKTDAVGDYLISVADKSNGFESFADKNQKLKLLARDDYSYDVEVYVMDGNDIIGGYKGEWDVYVKDSYDTATFNVLMFDSLTAEEMQDQITNLEANSKKISGPEIE